MWGVHNYTYIYAGKKKCREKKKDKKNKYTIFAIHVHYDMVIYARV